MPALVPAVLALESEALLVAQLEEAVRLSRWLRRALPRGALRVPQLLAVLAKAPEALRLEQVSAALWPLAVLPAKALALISALKAKAQPLALVSVQEAVRLLAVLALALIWIL